MKPPMNERSFIIDQLLPTSAIKFIQKSGKLVDYWLYICQIGWPNRSTY